MSVFKARLKSLYGLTIEQLDQMIKDRDGKCDMCGKTPKPDRRHPNIRYALVIDHDHGTGQVRGLLCTVCNLGLGHYEKFKNAAERYLGEH
jgi:hypothetical protein